MLVVVVAAAAAAVAMVVGAAAAVVEEVKKEKMTVALLKTCGSGCPRPWNAETPRLQPRCCWRFPPPSGRHSRQLQPLSA